MSMVNGEFADVCRASAHLLPGTEGLDLAVFNDGYLIRKIKVMDCGRSKRCILRLGGISY